MKKIILSSLICAAFSSNVSANVDEYIENGTGQQKSSSTIVVKSSASVKSVDFSSGFPSGGIFGFEGACPEGSSAMSMAGHTIVQVGQTHDGYMIYGYLMGARAGKQKVALTVTEIPSHQHGLSIEPDGSGGTGSISSGKHAPDRTWKTKAEGGGAYHENRMPYKVLNWCKQD